ncbi:hypothetical protein BT96DRAFT_789121, partial [Gymnopus androsaceus JB14]
WAAKRFWNTGNDIVTTEQNKTEVENEVLRLKQLQEILSEFMNHAKKNLANIKVANFHLAVEVVGSGEPSPASGITPDEYSALDQRKDFIIWLLEPMRSTTRQPNKWSGTMQHPAHNSKVGDTLTCFVHFAYQWTEKTMVFADLQTMRVGDPESGGEWQVLFDVMTHTLGGDSGVGDHGLKGIQEFVNMHQCNKKCNDLLLASLKEENTQKN